MVRRESGVNCFDGSKDFSPKKETYADAINDEAEGFIHVVDERDGYS